MTIDEAIKHAEEVATKMECESVCVEEAYQTAKQSDCEKCAEEHRQLAEWLKELKKYKEKDAPKLVIYIGDGMEYDWAECPSCGCTVAESDADWEMSYCPSCGQALKWEVEECR